MKKYLVGFAVALFLGLVVGLAIYYKYSQLGGALATGRLAPLPTGAHAVLVDTKGNLFARSFWVTFEAPAPAIQRWIQQSPGLAQLQPSACGRAVLYGEYPSWFRPTSLRECQLYELPQDQYANYGTVWIDLEMKVVYIKTSHS